MTSAAGASAVRLPKGDELLALVDRAGGVEPMARALGMKFRRLAALVTKARQARLRREVLASGEARMLPIAGARLDCTRDDACTRALVVLHPNAPECSCPPACPSFARRDPSREIAHHSAGRPGCGPIV